MSLISKATIRRHALEYAAGHRKLSDGSPRFTRIKPSFIEHIENTVRQAIEARVDFNGNAGRTLV